MRASRRLHRPWLAPPTTPADYDAFLRRARSEEFAPLLACRREDGAIVGIFTVSHIIRGAIRAERWREAQRPPTRPGGQ